MRAMARALCTTSRLPPPSRPESLTICLDLDETILYTEIAEAWEAETSSNFKEQGAEAARSYARARRISVGRPPDFEIELPYLEDPVPVYLRPELNDFLNEVWQGLLCTYPRAQTRWSVLVPCADVACWARHCPLDVGRRQLCLWACE